MTTQRIWSKLSHSLWFWPTAVVISSLVLAFALIELDYHAGYELQRFSPLFFGVGPEGARGMLSAIAGSMMTVASLTFSLTISILATASSQYSSRLIRNFMRDRYNQFVLGYFVGLFSYCLVVLRVIRAGDREFVPAIASLVGLVAAVVSIAVLILFIHRIASSIQAATILGRIGRETVRAIEKLFPSTIGNPKPPAALPAVVRWWPVRSGQAGYLQAIDEPQLLEIAKERDILLRMPLPVGSFVTSREALLEIADAEPDEAFCDELRGAVSLDDYRTIDQDAAYGFRQIVDIALRALSPGINDTSTAVQATHQLAEAVETLADRDIPPPVRADKSGRPRLIASGLDFDTLMSLALDQIRTAAKDNVAALQGLLGVLLAGARVTTSDDRRATLARHAEWIAKAADGNLKDEQDRRRLRLTLHDVLAALGLASSLDDNLPLTPRDPR